MAQQGLTPEQLEEIDEAFSYATKGKGGKLGAAELGACLRYLGVIIPPVDLVKLAGTGMDKQGLVRYFSNQFGALEATEEDVLQAFVVFDSGQGIISTPTMRNVLTGLGDRLDPDQVEPMLKQADQGDGNIDYRQFVRLMMEQK